MKKPYQVLRTSLFTLNINQTDAAEALGICRDTFSRKVLGKIPFTTSEMYSLIDMLGRPDEDLHVLFPRGGQS